MPTATTLPRPFNSASYARIDARYEAGDCCAEDNACVCCGRRTPGKLFAYVTNDNQFGSTPREDMDDIGFVRVGPVCARALRANNIRVWKNTELG